MLASASNDGTVKIWDADTTKEIQTLTSKYSKDGVYQVVFAADNNTLYTCGLDRIIRVWDLNAGREIKRLGQIPANPYGLAVSKDSRSVAVAGYDGYLRIWDTKTGTSSEYQLHDGNKKTMITYCIAFAGDDKAVVTAHEADNAARVTTLDKFIQFHEVAKKVVRDAKKIYRQGVARRAQRPRRLDPTDRFQPRRHHDGDGQL